MKQKYILLRQSVNKIFVLGTVVLLSAGCSLPGLGSSGPVGPAGVAKTTDGGETFKMSNSVANSKNSISGVTVTNMEFDPNSDQTVYLASSNTGLLVSTDSANSWKVILSKIAVYDLAVDPSDSKNIYAAGIYGAHGKIVRSQDGGSTWQEVYNESSSGNAVNSITINPGNTKEIYAILNSGVVIKSLDGGINWFVVYQFPGQATKIRYRGLNKVLYVLLPNAGIFTSSDGGVTWQTITQQISQQVSGASSFGQLEPSGLSSGFIKLGLDDQVADVIYVTTGSGLYKTADGGKSWVYLNIPVNKSAQLPRAIASTRGGMLAYTSIGSTLYKTLDGGKSWQTQELPTSNLVNKILIDTQLPQITYIGLISG